MISYFIYTLAAYLLGAVPAGLLVARARGMDIRTVGSGNIGATNVFRSVGKPWGILTFIIDALKGWIPAALFPLVQDAPYPALAGLAYGCAAIIGHNWPVYLRFKGGKGVATSAGMVLGVAPLAVGAGLAIWLILFGITQYVSVASIGAALAVPIAGWFLYYDPHRWILPSALTVLGALVVWRHRSNLQRLAQGTEHRFGNHKKQP